MFCLFHSQYFSLPPLIISVLLPLSVWHSLLRAREEGMGSLNSGELIPKGVLFCSVRTTFVLASQGVRVRIEMRALFVHPKFECCARWARASEGAQRPVRLSVTSYC